MKQETKNKLKKIAKVSGFAITFGFAVFGVLCAAMLIGNGSKKDDFKTLDSSLVLNEVRSERNIKPRKAVEVEEEYNLFLNYEQRIPSTTITSYGGGESLTFEIGANWDTYVWDSSLMPNGYYLLEGDYASYSEFGGFFMDNSEVADIANLEWGNRLTISHQFYSILFNYGNTSHYHQYFYIQWGDFDRFVINCRSNTSLYLTLVDTLDISTEDILELPDNWSPLRMVAKNVNKENNLIFDTDWNNWVDVPWANGQPMLDLSTMLFRNQGRVYNHIYIYFKNLNGLKYATNSENIGTGTTSDWCADRVEYALVLDNSLKYNYLASSVGTSILQGENVFNLGLNWSNPSARVLEILDKRYPSDLAFSNTLLGRFPRNGTNSLDPITGENIKPFGYGVWDYDYLFEYSNISSIDFVLGGSNDVFGLLTGAFNGLLPIFNVQILPNITLGILLFLPLIGGIIVIIIRVIKK